MDFTEPKRGKAIVAQASILKRVFAFITDMIFIEFVILFPFSRVLERIVPQESSISEAFNLLSSSYYESSLIVIGLLTAIPAIAYFVLLEKEFGQTIGKKLLGLYVISDKKEFKVWQAIARSMFLIPIFPFVLLTLIDPLVMLFTKEHQRLSEILSKTKVVEKHYI